MATTNDLKNGLVLNIDGQLWTVVEFQHVKPGKGGAFVRTKLKNVLSGKVVDRTFNAGVKVETATVDKRTMQYLYKDGTDWVFMDVQTYDQLPVSEGGRRRRRQVPAGEPGGHRRRARGRAALHRAPGVGGAARGVHRARPAGDRSTGGTKPARWRPGPRSPCRSSWSRASGSGWTPATARTWAVPERRRPSPAPRAADGRSGKARKRALDVLFGSEVGGRMPWSSWS